MGLLKGALTVRRFRVQGEVPDDFRTSYADALNDHAFRDPPSIAQGAETVGWCRVNNLLDTEFNDLNDWLFDRYLMAALRTDKKVLPARLFRAHLDKRIAAWCIEHGRGKAPASVRAELKEALEQEMYARTLPRVAVVEFCWNVVDGWVIFHSTSESANDRFRKLFRTTFGLGLLPFSPLDFLTETPELAQDLELQGISDYRAADAGEAM